jgi:predicted DNA-binding protein
VAGREAALGAVFASLELYMLSVPLNPDVERKLAELAKGRGQSESDLAREFIESSIEDLEDIQMAVVRLEKRGPVLTSEQARKELGLDD